MKFRLTNHAQQELERRKIAHELLESVLNTPQQIIPVREGRNAYQSIFEKDGKPYLLRVIVENDETIITVYQTSKIKKYWRET